MAKPKDANHALFIGYTIGSMMRHGMNVKPVVDDDGDYTDAIALRIEVPPSDPGDTTLTTTVTVIVPPPADNWSPELEA